MVPSFSFSCRYLLACKDVLETEILAIQGRGTHACPKVEQPIIYIESDSLEAVKRVQSGDISRSKYAFLIKEIKDSLMEYNLCITHVANKKTMLVISWRILEDHNVELMCGLGLVQMNL